MARGSPKEDLGPLGWLSKCGHLGHPPESNIVDVIPDGGRTFPECFIPRIQDGLQGIGKVINCMNLKAGRYEEEGRQKEGHNEPGDQDSG